MDFEKMTGDADRMLSRAIARSWYELASMPTDRLVGHARRYANDAARRLAMVNGRLVEMAGGKHDACDAIDRTIANFERPLDLPDMVQARQRVNGAWDLVVHLGRVDFQREFTGGDMQAMYLVIDTLLELKMWIAVVEQIDRNQDMFRAMAGSPHLRRHR